MARGDRDHSETINFGKTGFGTSLATPSRHAVGLQEIRRICGSGRYGGRVRTEGHEEPDHQGNDIAQRGRWFDSQSLRNQLVRACAARVLVAVLVRPSGRLRVGQRRQCFS